MTTPKAALPLTQADLTQADLTQADLTQADLTQADLTQADLTQADLTQADLTQADRHALALDAWPLACWWLSRNRGVVRVLGWDDAAGVAALALAWAARNHDPAKGNWRSYALMYLRHMLLTARNQAILPVGVTLRTLDTGLAHALPTRGTNEPDMEPARERIEGLLLQVPEIQATVLRLWYLEGLSNVEIGRAIGRTPTQVWRLRYNALAALRKLVS